ncbi:MULTISPECIES: DUF2804 domain-containing protein [unclassified Pseudoalteromonas]|uniref:DUF2804 domain-containing protein n=1 Tax=unclassified Pseudoalteromonas TaxID=194690 RepID=UPI0025B4C4C0|nr:MULTISPECIES: DUF2804 domain-containing protein [unclassified Pseudoalteromonas]MDN3377996.1 DUF2804 domain-containing protein [Pseudoalteromonas sp. APC 3893]MDN3386762.1 DUF2804 domain-containing protein [Pseudoalteromonas sp. APC 4017]
MKKLINQYGEAKFGVFEQGIEQINYLDFDLRGNMGKRKSLLAKKLKFNQFQFISFTCETLIVGLAIVDLKIASNCFVYVYHPSTGEFEECSFTNLFAIGTYIDPKPNSGKAHFHKGANSVTISAGSGQRKVTVCLKAGLKIKAAIDESVNYNPLTVCARAGFTGFHFTQKVAALPCSGSIEWRGKHINLEQVKALASVDWSAGFMRRETFWNWGSLACTLADGRRLGLNLAAGVVETGFTENALWLDDSLIKIDMVDFKFKRYGDKNDCRQWQLRSNDGIINLTFEPVGNRQDKTNLLIIASNFTQHFGRYYGEIILPDEVITLNGEWGFTEDHYAKW